MRGIRNNDIDDKACLVARLPRRFPGPRHVPAASTHGLPSLPHPRASHIRLHLHAARRPLHHLDANGTSTCYVIIVRQRVTS